MPIPFPEALGPDQQMWKGVVARQAMKEGFDDVSVVCETQSVKLHARQGKREGLTSLCEINHGGFDVVV